MTSSSLSETKNCEFMPLTPLEESFEDDNTTSLPVHHTSVHVMDSSNMTSSIPSLSIVSDEPMPSGDHTLSSRDNNKMATYRRPPVVISSLADPVLQRKLSRYLNGSFDTTLGYTTTTDVTSDTDSIDHVKHPLAVNGRKATHGRVDNDTRMPDKRTQSVTHKGTQGMMYKEIQNSPELDNLWKKFISSPLYTDWVKSKRSPDAKTEMCYCEELKQLEYKSKHCTKLPVKVQTTSHDHMAHGSANTNGDSHTTLYTDSAVQTSPSLLTTKSSDTSDAVLNDCPCTSSHVIKGTPPSSNNSFADQGSCDITGSCDATESCEQPASLTKLSLQEACHLFKRDFISNCRHRQRMIHHTRKQREEQLLVTKHQAALADIAKHYKSHYQNDNSRAVLATGMAAGKTTHRKMTPREMHEQTKRKWKMLPEVKQRQEEMKKKATAAINRMNMKLYQQKVLHNMRRKLT